MVYEIEKRSLFSSKKEFEKCEEKVATLGIKKERQAYRSYLFRKPTYLRIRIREGSTNAEITTKTGTYEDVARKETNKTVPLSKLSATIESLKQEGYEKCACVTAESHNYKVSGLLVSFNDMKELGMIVEIEALTERKEEVEELNKKITMLTKQLDLKELNAKTYQEMMNKMYEKELKNLDEQSWFSKESIEP